MTKVLTGVGAVFSAAHKNSAGELHGHDYEVTAWFDLQAGMDAPFLQSRLQRALAKYDHAVLDKPWAEDIALEISRELGAVQVDIARPMLRLYARAIV